MGFEPTNNGFAIRRLSPLGHAAESLHYQYKITGTEVNAPQSVTGQLALLPGKKFPQNALQGPPSWDPNSPAV